MSEMLTIGRIPEIVGAPLHRVRYALDTYGPAPAGRVGNYRVWSEESLPEIKATLERIGATKEALT